MTGFKFGALVLCLLCSSCATYTTLNQRAHQVPMVMSSTRMNVMAIRDRDRAERRFQAEPPGYPAADLPFSFALDVILLSITLPTAFVLSILD